MAEKTIEIPTLSMDDVLGDTMEKNQTMSIEKVYSDKEISSENADSMPDKSEEVDVNTESGKKSIYDLLEEEIMSAEISDAEKAKKFSRLLKIRGKKLILCWLGLREAEKVLR